MFKHYFEFGPHSHSRLFEKGDLKYVILDLLKDKPSHGYEIIHALEDRFHGFYSPSAGSVYPTLQLLEDLGYIKALEQDGKKIYTVTDEGKSFLKERGETIDKIKSHMHGWWGFEHRGELREVFDEFRGIGQTVVRNSRQLDAGQWGRIKEVLARTRQDIENILKEEK
jgi:DNA-binding PadR family transcriptional regulator